VVKVEPVLSLGKCYSCGEVVAWVEPWHWKKKLDLDPTPREFGQWIVLPDGVKAMSLANEEVQRLLGPDCIAEYHDAPRYVAHETVCRMAGFRTLDAARRNASGSQWQSAQREARRRRMLEADRLRDLESGRGHRRSTRG
jgi:hypothetical protein